MLKVPFYINLATGEVGSYLGDRPSDTAKEIIPRYRPINKVRGYWDSKDPIPDYAKHIIQPTNLTLPGVQKSYVVITEDSNGQHPWLDKVLALDKKSIAKLKKENDKLERDNEKLRMKIKELESQESKKRTSLTPYGGIPPLERY